MSDDRKRAVEEALQFLRSVDLNPESPGGAVVLEHLLRASSPPPSTETEGPAAAPSDQVRDLDDSASPAARLARWIGTDIDRIEDVVEFTADEPLLRIPVARLPRAKAERQRSLVLLKLAVERVAYDRSDVPAGKINAMCADYACMDQNLPANVSSRGDLATRRGKRGTYFYRATQPGIQRAKALLEELFETEEELRI
ncbi:MAG TPA: hypothetical protein VHW67_06525 [Solirubrobacteraceae bacterium]|jgi:hypothetical protein|nr:hypothetical protein [Solirubrobacteraceae bacterium]